MVSAPTLIDLRHFESVIRNGSISRAAKDLGVTQQAVSYRVRNLERLLGLELVQRSPFGVTATAAGAEILGEVQEVLAASARLAATASALRGHTAATTLSVGASQTIAAYLLPAWVMELRRRQTEAGSATTVVELRTANSEDVIALVRSGAIDLGFIEQPEPPRGLGSIPVGEDRMVVAVSPTHAWSTRTAVSIDELADVPLAAREAGSGTRAAFESAVLRAVGRPARPPLVSLATEAAIRSAVRSGVAPAVLSELAVRDDARLGRIHTLAVGPQPITRPLRAVWRGSKRDLAGTARELVAIAAAAGGGSSPGVPSDQGA
jgi:molybdate transport repressor ModE-like protein